jgi:hypothetical protein
MAIDADTTGNSATVLGTRDSCFEVTAGTSVNIDVTISNIPATYPMIGFGYFLYFDPDAFFPSAADSSFLLGAAPGSLEGQVTNDTVPGVFSVSGYDTGPVPGSSEASPGTGTGVLTRITLDVTDGISGAYPLHLIEAAHITTDPPPNQGKPPKNQFSAQLAVGIACAGLPEIEPPPTKNGDVDCSNTVNAIDALKVLRFTASLSVIQTEPCNDLGVLTPHVGDVDCNGAVNAIDALKILRFTASLPVQQEVGCPLLNT